MAHEETLEVTRADAEPRGEVLDRVLVEEAVVDQAQPAENRRGGAELGGAAGRRLRSALEARTEAEQSGGRRGRDEEHVSGQRAGARADRTAVDPGRPDAREEATVVPGIAGQPRVLAILGSAGARIGSPENVGHALFVAAAVLWAFYTVAMRSAGLDGLHAAAIAAGASPMVYVPVFVVFAPGNLGHAPLRDVAVQAIVQGVLTAVVSLVLYGHAVTLLGAASGAAFGALCPVITALLAIPILGERPAPGDWIGIGLISLGVYFVSGGPARLSR